MRIAKIGVIALFLFMALGGIGGRHARRLYLYFACWLSACTSLSNRRSAMIAASATSNAPWITYAVLNPLSPMMMGRTQRAGPYR
ncbi:putative inner membrane protein [Escherichia coli]|uniref:Putative inner membrane protein n=1 Tax=Escherichia coli TaxID=562 RepID=A0A376SA80_ECOLX|nr:putative inner membrane protein [Escherichia coli]